MSNMFAAVIDAAVKAFVRPKYTPASRRRAKRITRVVSALSLMALFAGYYEAFERLTRQASLGRGLALMGMGLLMVPAVAGLLALSNRIGKMALVEEPKAATS